MKLFKEYKQLNLNELADSVLNFWQEENIFQKSIQSREGKPKYVFFEGPPSANGMPGIHHVMARAIKDIFCRFHTLKGKQVERKAGWDTHGLPVELSVEKELGITKEDIGKKITIQEYNEACKKAVMRYTDAWNDLTQKIGYWVDLDKPYITYQPKYMETVWWLLQQIYNQKRLYKGYTIQPYSPKAGTGLSSHEINQPGMYREVTDTTVVAQFQLKKNAENHQVWNEILKLTGNHLDLENISTEGCGAAHHWKELDESSETNVYFLAWTTTPWTLPSNTALTVGSKIDYNLIKTFNQYTFKPIYVILAKNLVTKQFGKNYFETTELSDFQDFKEGDKKIPYQIIKEYKGNELIGIQYHQLLPWSIPCENPDKAFQIISGDFVTTEDGTGIVHTAPTFGADDAKVAKDFGIPAMLVLDAQEKQIPLVDLQGKFIEIDTIPQEFRGKYVKNEYYDEIPSDWKGTDVEIAIILKTENKAFKVEKYVHTYPHCWRTDKPILYYPLDSWFIKVSDVKSRLVDLNSTINWKPKSTGEGRFGNWLENANDWNLSRSRYWGIPLPIWRSEDKTEEICIGSVAELINEINNSIEAGYMKENPFKNFKIGDFSDENYELIDLHKNIVDEIILVSSSGKPMKRESDLIDVWFDSGAMPYAQIHYPFSTQKGELTADFIAEGVDQTRGWFYTLHVIAGLISNQVAYKNVVSNGLVLDKNGQKMSKRLGNAIDPFETLQKYGPDATRWYMISNAQPWENLKFDLEGIDEVRRKFFGTLHNTYSFFALYANVDKFTYSEDDIPFNERPELDRWILSELNLLIKQVDELFSDYEPTRATRLISDFVTDNLSNWFVRLSRRRFWKGDYTHDKISAYQTLYKCLETIAILISPVAPFFAERLFKDLNFATRRNHQISVHLTDFPSFKNEEIDEVLIERTRLTQQITSMIFSLRKTENLKVRQPLAKALIPILDENIQIHLEAAKELIQQEVNIKEIELIAPEQASKIIEKSVKPNFKILGPKLGKELKRVGDLLTQLSKDEIFKLENEGKILIESYEILLTEVEILTKDLPGWKVISDGKLTVALDISLTKELVNEGITREFVNRIQNIRKDKNFELTDKISIQIQKNEFDVAIESNKTYLMQETLAEELIFVEKLENAEKIEVNEKEIFIIVNKL
jgi:isoleucyl-tRNA synthetase